MRRRDVLHFMAGAVALAFPRVGNAQQRPVVGFIHSASPSYFAQFEAAARLGYRDAGYVENQNLTIEYRWAEGHYNRLPELAQDLVNRQVSVIFAAGGTDPAKAAKAATATIPIVFISAADPVKTGIVPSLNRPGGNITGVSLLASSLDAKKLGLLHELVPTAAVVAALLNPDYPGAQTQSAEFERAAHALGIQPVLLRARTDAEIGTAFAQLRPHQAKALVVSSDPFFNSRRELFAELEAQSGIAVVYSQREYVTAGGLMSYGPDFADGYRQAANYVGRILSGAKPADLPVLQPTRFNLAINLRTAKHSKLAVPATLLALADEVIE